MKRPDPKPAAVPLSERTLTQLPDSVKVPRYDRRKITPGIIHIGLGNFHRAHQSWYLHRLMQQGLASDWGIIGAGVRPNDAEMRRRLREQDCLTTLIELDPMTSDIEVVGPMIDFLPVEPANGALISAMSAPEIRIVSLTVTEGGYYQTEDGAFDANHPDIAHDAAYPDQPTTAFGAMVAAYRARRAAGLAPFTGQSCDNLQNNGDVLQRTIVGLARLSDPTLAEWIAEKASFPNAMVDCIVPATGAAERAAVQDLGIEDAAPVTHENYRQWVLQDRFCAGRPPWERAGVTITDNVHAYERMKIRVLNAGHQILANVGEVLGLQTISDCMQDPDTAAFFCKVQQEEVLPYVESVGDTSPQDYLELIKRRFSNPMINDTTRRVAFDGSARHPGFVLPILRDAIAAGGALSGLALVEALWARMCLGEREDGSTIAPNDPHWDDLHRLAQRARSDPDAWLENGQIYGDLKDHRAFNQAFGFWLTWIGQKGARSALRHYVSGADI
ncbi:mannitol dehydrogenase family protein [Shimia sp. R10_1]|uniref:mannitol dehydrogenase family protein n=1 Tax=Shimia sp. R10_1 TaxID=2821095 RepID=UPI001AD9578F|nr:mannitol dehydrogenase family protein [Shimia sp. R10_1]MBO9474757.1 mannitol dehydrogenase family protein [Shimia sp. R10_1]